MPMNEGMDVNVEREIVALRAVVKYRCRFDFEVPIAQFAFHQRPPETVSNREVWDAVYRTLGEWLEKGTDARGPTRTYTDKRELNHRETESAEGREEILLDHAQAVAHQLEITTL